MKMILYMAKVTNMNIKNTIMIEKIKIIRDALLENKVQKVIQVVKVQKVIWVILVLLVLLVLLAQREQEVQEELKEIQGQEVKPDVEFKDLEVRLVLQDHRAYKEFVVM